MQLRLLVATLSAIVGTAACGVSIMTYNVENLFDTVDDPLKSDETFLPLSLKQSRSHQMKCERIEKTKWREACLRFDWSDEALRIKIERIGGVIRAYQNGKGPDLVGLQEVENLSVLRQLQASSLRDLGYHDPILIEGQDLRGIDVAVLSRLEQLSAPVLHPIPFKGMSPAQLQDSRGILQTHWRRPDGGELIVLIAHFPAPFHPRKFREQALRHVLKLSEKWPEKIAVALMGDLNIPKEEDEAFEVSSILERGGWLWAHQVACGADCLGTTFYPPKKTWSFLDRIALRKSGSIRFKPKSAKVWTPLLVQKDAQGHPAPFIPPRTGVSDHFPLVVELEANQ